MKMNPNLCKILKVSQNYKPITKKTATNKCRSPNLLINNFHNHFLNFFRNNVKTQRFE